MVISNSMHYLQTENSRLREANARMAERLHRLQHALRALNHLLDLLPEITPESDALAVVYRLLETTLQAIGSENGSLLLLDEEKNELVFAAVAGPYAEPLQGYRIPADEGVVGWCITNRQPRLVADVRLDPYFSPAVDRYTTFQTQSLIAIPLVKEERIYGALEVVNTTSGEPFTEEDEDIVRLVAYLTTEVLARAEQAMA
ncbi:MAG: GAF domain-containing protein [Anaerolineae bacterium]|nr:MAG: GAF domain-containing protein [Anaerolineae bacterium]